MTTVAEAVRAATARLAAVGVPSPRHDAEALAAHVLGVPRSALVVATSIDTAAYDALVTRRAAREPLQHLIGRAGFRRLDLAVGPGVFVPRPETEVLVDWCLAMLPTRGLLVDLCAGSGAIALAVADERPDVTAYAVEREPAAHAWLERNVAGTAVVAVRADAADALPDLAGTVDVVASNPPYIPVDGAPLDPEVARHDPPAALWSGADGLGTIRLVQRRASVLLRPGGHLVVEHADQQTAPVTALLRAAGWADVADHRDLAGRDRFATARWPG